MVSVKRGVVVELSEALAFAEMVQHALPVDEEADRLADAALRRHGESRPLRKLTQKIPSGG